MALRFVSLLSIAALLGLSVHVNGDGNETFYALKEKVSNLLLAAPVFPSNKKQFVAILAAGGINLAALRDKWGRRYRLSAKVELVTTYWLHIYTDSQYASTGLGNNNCATQLVTLTIESAGPDGRRDTTDDVIAEFTYPLAQDENGFSAGSAQTMSTPFNGKGEITGILFNEKHQPVPNAQITLSRAC